MRCGIGAGRAVLLAFAALSSVYGLLCWVTFSWSYFISSHTYPAWVEVFLHLHPVLCAGVFAFAGVCLEGKRRWAWWTAGAAAALGLFLSGIPAGLRNDGWSLLFAFAALAPYLAWEAMLPEASLEEGPSGHPLSPALAGVLCALAGFGTRLAAGGLPPAGERIGEAVALGRSCLAHAALFLGFALLFEPAKGLWRVLLFCGAAAWFAGSWGLGALSFTGPWAWAYAAALGSCAGLALLRSDRALGSAARACACPPWRLAVSLPVLAVLPATAHLALRGSDWNRLFETALVLLVWRAAAAVLSGVPAAADPGRRTRLLAGGALALVLLAWAAEGASMLADRALRRRAILLPEAALALADRDSSFAAARRILAWPSGSSEFFAFLRRNTSLPKGSTKRVESDQVADWPQGKPGPHIFIVVVDSLRPDYLGAYNPAVRFTPAMDAFAKDADVFRAYTSYGATGLSEAAIWAGARIPHEYYPDPFYGLNGLEKLAQRGGWRLLPSMDLILERILLPESAAAGSDPMLSSDHGFCASLEWFEDRLDRELAAGKPLLFYDQPQDIHVAVLRRKGGRVPDDPRWQGFNPAYASRLSAVDGCFGRFIDGLKKRGIYDKSVIALTSDHGDSLGEEGRWGHAYLLTPEILRIPLIIRVPRRLREGFQADLESAAFSTDLIPSLYALAGRPPTARGEPFGRSLYAPALEELRATRRAVRPVVSSYGPVYGLVGGDGAWLFVADAVESRTLWFDLKQKGSVELGQAAPEREDEARSALRGQLEALRAFYRY